MDVWDRVMEINVKSFALTARHAVPEMKKAGGGSMVHFASTDAMRGDAKPQDAYGCSKAAVVRLSKSLAVQFARDGIRSNTVLPGPVHTPMQARWDGDEETQVAIANHVPAGRIGTTEDMAQACLFLLSDKASFITGTELVVDGGLGRFALALSRIPAADTGVTPRIIRVLADARGQRVWSAALIRGHARPD